MDFGLLDPHEHLNQLPLGHRRKVEIEWRIMVGELAWVSGDVLGALEVRCSAQGQEEVCGQNRMQHLFDDDAPEKKRWLRFVFFDREHGIEIQRHCSQLYLDGSLDMAE